MHCLNYLLLYWRPLLWSLVLLLLICLTNMCFVLPISGFSLLGYVVIITVSSTWLSFVTLQNFLQQNKQINLLNLLKFKVKSKEHEVDHLKAVKQLTQDIDEFFIQKWFVYISEDPTFNKESEALLEEILKKIINVQVNIDKEVIIQGVLNLYLKHLKEFRRSLKRREKYMGKITDLYRYSHSCSTSKRAKNYFIHQLTVNLLNHFINWELGNSLPYQILVSIISKKVLFYILNLLSDPEFLNYYILVTCASKTKKLELKLETYNRVRITSLTEKGDVTPTELAQSGSSENLAKIDIKSEILDIIDSAKHVETFELKTDDVKIYEPRSCKTWYDTIDLSSIPLGTDILDTISLGDSDKDFDTTLTEPEKDILSPMSSAKNLLDEVKNITSLEGFKTSMKPISDVTATTFHNIKDFQETTVNSVVKPVSQVTTTALHKIGGLHLQGKTESKPEPSPKIPSIQTQEEASPEPEYEETADLATSIARLRSLLEQKSSESNLSTPALSPMPSDDLFHKNLAESEDVDETDGTAASFYKFCAKTATGVIHNTLNTIKTALPGNVADCDTYDGHEKWLFVESNAKESDLFVRMHKLLCERKVFCTVDTAYEAIDSLGSLEQGEKLRQSNIQFEDELDDFEVKLPVTKALCDILCELLADTKDTSLVQEPVIKSVMLLFGNFIEENVVDHANYYLRYGCANARIPSESKIDTLSLEQNEFVDVVLSGIPDYIKYLVGDQALRDVANLFVASLQVQKINQDFMMQIFEVLCMKMMDGSKQMSPVFA